jgi:arylsulfatase A-like enzyme
MTSLYPSQHGAYKPFATLDEDFEVLAEILQKHSYITAAFTGGGWLSKWYGLHQGFEFFDEKAEHNLNLIYKPTPHRLNFPLFTRKRDFSFLLPKVIDWLKYNRRNKFFLFIHTYQVHDYFHNNKRLKPYLRKLGFKYNKNIKKLAEGNLDMGNNLIKSLLNADTIVLEYLKAAYDAEIMHTDRLLKALFDELHNLDLDQNTLIVFTSDHGEGFNNALKRLHHGGRLHNDQILVPLVFRFPGSIPSNQIIYEPVQLIDILPTILEFLSLPKLPHSQGNSLLGLILGKRSEHDKPAFSEELAYRINKMWLREAIKDTYRMVSIISKDFKLIQSPDFSELYDFKNDIFEINNIFDDRFSSIGDLRNKIEAFAAVNKPLPLSKKSATQINGGIDKENLDQLRSLGYIN